MAESGQFDGFGPDSGGKVEVKFQRAFRMNAGEAGERFEAQFRANFGGELAGGTVEVKLEIEFLAARGEGELGFDSVPCRILRRNDRFDRNQKHTTFIVDSKPHFTEGDAADDDLSGGFLPGRTGRFVRLLCRLGEGLPQAIEVDAGQLEFSGFPANADFSAAQRKVLDAEHLRSASGQAGRVIRADGIDREDAALCISEPETLQVGPGEADSADFELHLVLTEVVAELRKKSGGEPLRQIPVPDDQSGSGAGEQEKYEKKQENQQNSPEQFGFFTHNTIFLCRNG